MTKLEIDSYLVTDDFFGRPYIDVDEWRESPVPHRYLHGGFEDTTTRFAFCFPPAEQYQGRLYQPLEGANAGHEDVASGPLGMVTGGPEMIFGLGGYMVESNMGHVGDVKDPKAGDDPTVYGWRAAAESARFSKHLAAQVLGSAPRYSYVYGGSGGARRSPLCLAYAPDVWDAALPFMGDAMDGEYGDWRPYRQGAGNFASMFNVQRVLRDKLADVIDAMAPGGSGNPFETLDSHQRDELAALYRLGFPRGDEFMIGQPMGQMWLWTSMAERITAEDPYFTAFWQEPGHLGHDQPELLRDDLVHAEIKVKRVLTAADLSTDPELNRPELAALKAMATIMASMSNLLDTPIVVQLEQAPKGYLLGAGVRVLDGDAAGRQLYCLQGVDDLLFCDGEGEASNRRFDGVRAGDTVVFDNRDFLAYCYYARHHLHPGPEYDFLRLDGLPIYKQYQQPEMSPFMGTPHTGRFDGKMLWVHHTHDSSLWPSQGIGMKNNVERERGVEGAREHFRLRWTENAEHMPPFMAASAPDRANSTWLIDYLPVIEQSLADLTAWVEEGTEPAETAFSMVDGQILLPRAAAERGGIQPVVVVTANGAARAEVAAGEEVTLEVRAEVPPGAGTVILVKWDFDGTGTYPVTTEVDGTKPAETLTTTHRYERPGTYFATALVESHRDGKVDVKNRRIANLAAARVIVS
jgi:hypothetical protein